jgi:hypothetical protein
MLYKRPTAGNINSTILPPSQKTSELPYDRERDKLVIICVN